MGRPVASQYAVELDSFGVFCCFLCLFLKVASCLSPHVGHHKRKNQTTFWQMWENFIPDASILLESQFFGLENSLLKLLPNVSHFDRWCW